MNFIALIVALAYTPLLEPGGRLQSDTWYQRWRAAIAEFRLPAWIELLAITLLPALAVELLLDAVGFVLFGLIHIIIGAVVLIYSLGRRDYHTMLASYQAHCETGDLEGAWLTAKPWLTPADQAAGAGEAPDSAGSLQRLFRRAMLAEACRRWFCPVFWFVIGGPALALGYRLVALEAGRSGSEAQVLLAAADWVPARLLGLTFTLTGNFHAAGAAVAQVTDIAAPLEDALDTTALAAIGASAETPAQPGSGAAMAEEIRSLTGLCARSATAWVVIISVLVLLT